MIGQPIGCIVADDVETARRAAQLVNVEYEKLPAILTMEVSEYCRDYQDFDASPIFIGCDRRPKLSTSEANAVRQVAGGGG